MNKVMVWIEVREVLPGLYKVYTTIEVVHIWIIFNKDLGYIH